MALFLPCCFQSIVRTVSLGNILTINHIQNTAVLTLLKRRQGKNTWKRIANPNVPRSFTPTLKQNIMQ